MYFSGRLLLINLVERVLMYDVIIVDRGGRKFVAQANIVQEFVKVEIILSFNGTGIFGLFSRGFTSV